ncbi:hypothetical protein [Candidatus Caldatribacterium sp.]|uniref:hypothetical protein n=1 Tax=Candidatus Caldatribacterium sp. TaxID=2282143 RepID=UPI003840C681|nr:hypothetical protein [Candidatus Caldatribacterium sp.]
MSEEDLNLSPFFLYLVVNHHLCFIASPTWPIAQRTIHLFLSAYRKALETSIVWYVRADEQLQNFVHLAEIPEPSCN